MPFESMRECQPASFLLLSPAASSLLVSLAASSLLPAASSSRIGEGVQPLGELVLQAGELIKRN